MSEHTDRLRRAIDHMELRYTKERVAVARLQGRVDKLEIENWYLRKQIRDMQGERLRANVGSVNLEVQGDGRN